MSVPPVHAHTLQIPVLMPSDVYCASCVETLRAAVRELPGVESADVDRRTSTLTVVHDTAILPEERIEQEARRLGLEIGSGKAHAVWRVTGLD